MPRLGILLLNLGGPDSLDAVRPFLFNLFSDPDIFRLPFSSVMQKPLAWWITYNRYKIAQENYANIGGRSPILPLTQDQADCLQRELAAQGVDATIYIAMRYWHPFTEEALHKMAVDGITDVVVLPLYPHFSLSTTGSSMNELKREMARLNIRFDSLKVVPPYYKHPDYLASLAETIDEGLLSHEWSCPREQVRILFSAHSLPKKFVEKTKDPYPNQIYACAQSVMQTHFPNNPWDLCYQSKVGKMPWLGPSTDGVLHYFAAQNEENLLLVPISFVSDHIETLEEIDQQYLPLAAELGIPHCHRAPALNSRPRFIQALATLVQTVYKQPVVPHLVAS